MTIAADGQERFGRLFVLLLALGISLIFFLMIRGLAAAVLLAAIFAGMFSPLHVRMTRLLRGRHRLAAVVTILVTVLVILVPLAAFTGLVVSQAVEVSQSVGPWVQRELSRPDELDRLLSRLPLYEHWSVYQDQIMAKVGEMAGRMGSFFVSLLASATKGTASFLLSLFVMLYAMFFFLVGGRQILDRILFYLPMQPDDERVMVDKFVSVTRATLKGSLVIGIVQGGLAGIAFHFAGIPGAAFWGTVMAVLSIIPAVGTGLIWVPAVIWLFLAGRTGAAVGLGIWCLAVVGSVDNFLRPALVGRDTKMSDLLVLLGTLGGLFLFGAVGFIIGPLVAALFVSIWEIYGRVFGPWLPAVPGSLMTSPAGSPSAGPPPATAPPAPSESGEGGTP